jgi:hypothetical protein
MNIYKWTSALLVGLLLITSILTVDVIEEKKNLNDDLDRLSDKYIDTKKEIINLKIDINKWKTLYENYECPEPEVITKYINTTETIWNNNTIYLDNAIFDINRDGIVDYKDVCEVYSYLKKQPKMIENWFYNKYGNPYERLYDVNIDGNVNIIDVELILEYCD